MPLGTMAITQQVTLALPYHYSLIICNQNFISNQQQHLLFIAQIKLRRGRLHVYPKQDSKPILWPHNAESLHNLQQSVTNLVVPCINLTIIIISKRSVAQVSTNINFSVATNPKLQQLRFECILLKLQACNVCKRHLRLYNMCTYIFMHKLVHKVYENTYSTICYPKWFDSGPSYWECAG